MTQINTLALNEIYNMDCLDGMKLIEDNSVDLVLCDLPYGITSCKWDSKIPFDKLWEQYNRIVKEDGVVVLFGSQPFTTEIINSNKKDYRYNWYWVKNGVTGFAFAKYQPMRKVEEIVVFYKKAPKYNPQGIVKLDNPKKKVRKKPEKDFIYDKETLSNEYVQEYTNYPNNAL